MQSESGIIIRRAYEKTQHTHTNTHFPSKPNILQIKPVIAERDLVAVEPVADLAPALLEERCILSHGNCGNVEISASMSTVSRTDSAVRGGSSIKQVSTHMHAVLSHHTAGFFFFLTLQDVSADKQVSVFSGARKERSRPDGGVHRVLSLFLLLRPV